MIFRIFSGIIDNIFGSMKESMDSYLEQILSSMMTWESQMINYLTLLFKERRVREEYYTIYSPFHFAQFRATLVLSIISHIVSIFVYEYSNMLMSLIYLTIFCLFLAIFLLISFHSYINKQVKLFTFLVIYSIYIIL